MLPGEIEELTFDAATNFRLLLSITEILFEDTNGARADRVDVDEALDNDVAGRVTALSAVIGDERLNSAFAVAEIAVATLDLVEDPFLIADGIVEPFLVTAVISALVAIFGTAPVDADTPGETILFGLDVVEVNGFTDSGARFIVVPGFFIVEQASSAGDCLAGVCVMLEDLLANGVPDECAIDKSFLYILEGVVEDILVANILLTAGVCIDNGLIALLTFVEKPGVIFESI